MLKVNNARKVFFTEAEYKSPIKFLPDDGATPCKSFCLLGIVNAGGRSRTDTSRKGRQILSLVRLPVPPLRHSEKRRLIVSCETARCK